MLSKSLSKMLGARDNRLTHPVEIVSCANGCQKFIGSSGSSAGSALNGMGGGGTPGGGARRGST